MTTAAALWLAFGLTLVGAACAPSVPASVPAQPAVPTDPSAPTEPPAGDPTTCDPSVTCIAAGGACQFSQQCCDGIPCTDPAGAGNLRCFACNPTGSACSGVGDATCCFGTSCTGSVAGGYVCAAVTPPNYSPPTCAWPGTKCSTGSECCTGVCDKHRCAPCPPRVACEYEPMCLVPGNVCQFSEQCCGLPCVPDGDGTLRCLGCFPEGTTCSAWSECCSRWCENGTCQIPPVCSEPGQPCMTSGDCCSGVACDLPPGETSGVCRPPCMWTGGSCTAGGDCCSGTCAIAAGATTGTCCSSAP